MVASFLSVEDHLTVAARLNKAVLAACKLPYSWPATLVLRNIVPPVDCSWLKNWGFEIKRLALDFGSGSDNLRCMNEDAMAGTRSLLLHCAPRLLSLKLEGLETLCVTLNKCDFGALQRLEIQLPCWQSINAAFTFPAVTELIVNPPLVADLDVPCSWPKHIFPALQQLHLLNQAVLPSETVKPVLSSISFRTSKRMSEKAQQLLLDCPQLRSVSLSWDCTSRHHDLDYARRLAENPLPIAHLCLQNVDHPLADRGTLRQALLHFRDIPALGALTVQGWSPIDILRGDSEPRRPSAVDLPSLLAPWSGRRLRRLRLERLTLSLPELRVLAQQQAAGTDVEIGGHSSQDSGAADAWCEAAAGVTRVEAAELVGKTAAQLLRRVRFAGVV